MHDIEQAAVSMDEAVEAGTIIKCKPWGEGQGAFVYVNAADFDPDFHQRFADPLDHDGDGKRGGSKPRKKVEA